MENLRIARVLLKLAKYLEAEYEYKSDPEHKHKPKDGGWKETEQGWSKSDNFIQKPDSNISDSNSKIKNNIEIPQCGNVKAPIRKFLQEVSNNSVFEISESDQKQATNPIKFIKKSKIKLIGK